MQSIDLINKNRSIYYLTILIALSSVFFLPGVLASRDFWVQDEARYAEVVREMVYDSQWLVPHLNGHFYPDKPPIYFWLVKLNSMIFGEISPFSFVSITFLSALGCIVSTYYFGKYLFNRRAGFISGLILTSSLLFIISAQIARMDMLFTLFIMLAIFSFYYAYNSRQPKYYFIFYLFGALAIFTKGPLGFVFPLLTGMIFFIYKKNFKELKALILNKGAIFFFLIILAWVLLLLINGHKDYFSDIITKQILGRAMNSFSHKEPVYFYLVLLPLLFYPWIFFLPKALLHSYSMSKESYELLLIWFFSGFVVMSILSGKLFIYLLPLFPALSLIIGKFFSDLFGEGGKVADQLLPERTISCSISCLFAIIFPLVFVHYFPEEKRLFIPMVIFIAPLIILSIIFCRKYNLIIFLSLSVLGPLAFSSFSFGYVIPNLNKYLSSRLLSEKIDALSQDGFYATSYDVTRGIFNFYAHRKIKEVSLEELQNSFNSKKKVICVLRKHNWQRIAKLNIKKVGIIGEYEVVSKNYVLITNMPEKIILNNR